jgi:hypothetical protein
MPARAIPRLRRRPLHRRNGTTGARGQLSLGASVNGVNATVNASDVWTPILGLNYLTVSEQEAASQTCTVGGTAVNRALIWG